MRKVKIAVWIGIEQRPDRDLLAADFHADDDGEQSRVTLSRADNPRERRAELAVRQIGAAGGRVELMQIMVELRFFRFKRIDTRGQFRRIQTSKNGINAALYLRLHVSAPGRQRGEPLQHITLHLFPFLAHDGNEAVKICGISKYQAHKIGDTLLQLIGAHGDIVTVAAPLFAGTAVIIIFLAADVGGRDRHRRAALTAENFTFERVLPRRSRPPGLLFFILCHAPLHLLPCFPVDNGRDSVLQTDHVSAGRRVTVSAPVRITADAAIAEHPDVLLIFQKIVQTVRPESAAALGTPPGRVQPGDNLPIAGAAGVGGEDLAHNGGLGLTDHEAAVPDLKAESGLPAGKLSAFGHEPHFLHYLLPRLEGPALRENGRDSLAHKIRGVPQVAAYHRLRDGDDAGAEPVQLGAEREPGRHFAEHTALIVDDHGIGAAGA